MYEVLPNPKRFLFILLNKCSKFDVIPSHPTQPFSHPSKSILSFSLLNLETLGSSECQGGDLDYDPGCSTSALSAGAPLPSVVSASYHSPQSRQATKEK